MSIAIKVNAATCIRCGKCVKVCPFVIFQSGEGGEIRLENIDTCIVCGHCAAVCPTGSVIHSEFPAEKVHPIDYDSMPSPEQVMLLCKSRRSNRNFSKKPIPEQSLNAILEAAHRAPTSTNSQQVKFTLVTDPEALKTITRHTIEILEGIARKVMNPLLKPIIKMTTPEVFRYLPVIDGLSSNYKKGKDEILRGATAVLFVHAPKTMWGTTDASLAYQNGSLMAESLGVGQFYAGFVHAAIKQDKKNGLSRLLGIDGNIQACMALGMPSFRFPNYIDKHDIEVKRV